MNASTTAASGYTMFITVPSSKRTMTMTRYAIAIAMVSSGDSHNGNMSTISPMTAVTSATQSNVVVSLAEPRYVPVRIVLAALACRKTPGSREDLFVGAILVHLHVSHAGANRVELGEQAGSLERHGRLAMLGRSRLRDALAEDDVSRSRDRVGERDVASLVVGLLREREVEHDHGGTR